MKKDEQRKKEIILKAEYGSPDHPLTIGNLQIPCYVLEDGTRVLVMRGMLKAMDMSTGGLAGDNEDRLVRFSNTKSIKPFISDNLLMMIKKPIKFKAPSAGAYSKGYEATILADLCDAVLEARKMGALLPQQQHIADRCEILIRGWARVGIIALVDEATGYQEVRTKRALAEILEKFIAKELQPWVKTFQDDFYEQIFRLNGWPYTAESLKKRPGVIGKWTNDIVYDRLAPNVKDALNNLVGRDEKGRLRAKLFQGLTRDIGYQKLLEHIAAVKALMKASTTWPKFKRMLNRALPKYNETLELPYSEEDK